MRNRRIILALAVAAVLFAPRMISAASSPAVGSQAPDFSLNSQEGQPVRLSQFRGSWVVLYFYPKDFTGGCTIEAHNFQRDQDKYRQMKAVVLGVSVDSEESHKRFCAKEGLNFKLLADTGHKVSTEYGSLINLGVAKFAARHTFVIDPTGKIMKVFTDVNPNKHSDEVLAVLNNLQKPAGGSQ